MKVFMALAAPLLILGCDTPVRAQAVVPEIATRCLMRDHDAGGALANCTEAIDAGGMSAELTALVYNARGEANCARHEYDLALADQNEAIRLVPDFPDAFFDRASCHLGKNDIKSAFADYDEAIRLAPRVPGYYRYRAELYNWTGDHDRALADYDAAIRIAPRSTTDMDERAMTLFDLGRYDEAAAQFGPVIRLTPGDSFPVLWRHIARLRSHTPDAEEFATGIGTLDLSAWPGPVFDLFLGKTSFNAMRNASDRSPDGPAEGECEVAVFGGEYYLTKGESAAAKQ